MLYVKGLSKTEAAREAGYKSNAHPTKLLNSEEGKAILEYFRERILEPTNITIELVTTMLLEAHKKSATATEEIAAIRELAKMHDLYQDQKENRAARGSSVQLVQNNVYTNVKQLDNLSDAELLALAGEEIQGKIAPTIIDVTKEPDYDPVLDV